LVYLSLKGYIPYLFSAIYLTLPQKQSWFKRLQRFRAGIEARISLLKRKFGLKRSRLRGSPGVHIWVGQGIFAYNLWQATRIA
jgi:hypothetical protein